MVGMLSRIVPPWLKRAAVPGEGQWRPGPYLLSGGWLPAGTPWNYWQSGRDVQPYGGPSAMVEACVSAYSQTISMCQGDHWLRLANGGRERVTTSALSRIIRKPNDYQSISDFMLNLTRRLFERGESFAVARRNNRGEISELHLMREGSASVAVDGSVFYSLHGNEVFEQRIDMSQPVPARDVLHVRLHTPTHILKGVSPLLAAVLERALSGAALSQQIAFYLNQARPSFVLETDQRVASQEEADALRAKWEALTTGENAGRTPFLTNGVKAKPLSISPQDGQLAELLKSSDQHIALVYRIPLEILGMQGGTFASTEALMQAWISSGFGFCCSHVEEAFGLLFGLKGVPDEYLEFDTRALLRSAYKERIEGLARGVISGIYSPDEARAAEDLPAVPGGHGAMPRCQQQVVPLSYGTDLQPPNPNPPPEPAPPDNPDDEGDDAGDATTADELDKALSVYRSQRHALAA